MNSKQGIFIGGVAMVAILFLALVMSMITKSAFIEALGFILLMAGVYGAVMLGAVGFIVIYEALGKEG